MIAKIEDAERNALRDATVLDLIGGKIPTARHD